MKNESMWINTRANPQINKTKCEITYKKCTKLKPTSDEGKKWKMLTYMQIT
jgi:hypothetical protein